MHRLVMPRSISVFSFLQHLWNLLLFVRVSFALRKSYLSLKVLKFWSCKEWPRYCTEGVCGKNVLPVLFSFFLIFNPLNGIKATDKIFSLQLLYMQICLSIIIVCGVHSETWRMRMSNFLAFAAALVSAFVYPWSTWTVWSNSHIWINFSFIPR